VEKAYDKLKPFVTVKRRRKEPGSAPPSSPGPKGVTVENRFSGLRVDETSEPHDTAATDETEEIEDELPHVPPVQVERDDDEFHFQICMLLDELHKILDVVLRQWELYRDGKIDVVVPALATNIAIDLVRQAELEFEDVVVRPKKYPEAKFPFGRCLLSPTSAKTRVSIAILGRNGSSRVIQTTLGIPVSTHWRVPTLL
jgi:hypothetical protein